jgi:hypothetical protein
MSKPYRTTDVPACAETTGRLERAIAWLSVHMWPCVVAIYFFVSTVVWFLALPGRVPRAELDGDAQAHCVAVIFIGVGPIVGSIMAAARSDYPDAKPLPDIARAWLVLAWLQFGLLVIASASIEVIAG